MEPPQRRSLDRTGAAGAAPLRWPAELLWAQLEPLRPGLTVEVLPETDSTNSRLLERARRGEGAPCLLVAEHQTAGRGRLGRSWISDLPTQRAPLGPGSLTFSLGLRLAPSDWSGLSLAVGVALAEALHPRVRLKWPNDLWLLPGGPDGESAGEGLGRKLGGVLIETVPLAAGGRYAVIGIGLNLEAPQPQPGLDQPAAGWREIESQARAPDLLVRLAPPLLSALASFEAHGFPAFAARFAARDALVGRPVRSTQPGAAEGVADGVDARGALRLQTDAGLRLIDAGDVSVRPC